MTTDDRPLDRSGGHAYPTLEVAKTDEFGGEGLRDAPGMTLHDRTALHLLGHVVQVAYASKHGSAGFDAACGDGHGMLEAVRLALDFADEFVAERRRRLEAADRVVDDPPPGTLEEMAEHATIFRRVVEDVNQRSARANVDTLKEITESELDELHEAARRIVACALDRPPTTRGDRRVDIVAEFDAACAAVAKVMPHELREKIEKSLREHGIPYSTESIDSLVEVILQIRERRDVQPGDAVWREPTNAPLNPTFDVPWDGKHRPLPGQTFSVADGTDPKSVEELPWHPDDPRRPK